jgi:hypothetical protein
MPDRPAGEGLHEVSNNDESLTVNNTDDPKYPSGSYYVSQTTTDGGKVTTIHDSDGNQIGQSDKAPKK